MRINTLEWTKKEPRQAYQEWLGLRERWLQWLRDSSGLEIPTDRDGLVQAWTWAVEWMGLDENRPPALDEPMPVWWQSEGNGRQDVGAVSTDALTVLLAEAILQARPAFVLAMLERPNACGSSAPTNRRFYEHQMLPPVLLHYTTWRSVAGTFGLDGYPPSVPGRAPEHLAEKLDGAIAPPTVL